MDEKLAPLESTGPAATRSFSCFYSDEYRSVAGLAYVLTGDYYAAEDLAQDAFIAAQRHWGTVGAYDSPEAWVRRVLVNRSRSRFRRLGREHGALNRIWSDDRGDPPPGLEAEAVELWQEVRKLPRRQAQAIALTYLDGFGHDEIARIIGCSPLTVKTHLQRGKRTLARRLGTEGRSRT